MARTDPASVGRLLRELKAPFVLLTYDGIGNLIIVGECAGVYAFAASTGDNSSDCVDGIAQAGDGLGVSGPPLRTVELGAGAARNVALTGALARGVRWKAKLPESFLAQAAQRLDASLMIPTPQRGVEEEVNAFLAQGFPEVSFRSGSKDPDSLGIYASYSSISVVAFGVAFIMAGAALAFLAMELAWSHARESSAIAAVGVPEVAIRAAAAVQSAWPVVAVFPAVLFGLLGGYSMRSYFGTTELLEPAIFTAVVVPWLASVGIALLVGFATASAGFRRDAVSDGAAY